MYDGAWDVVSGGAYVSRRCSQLRLCRAPPSNKPSSREKLPAFFQKRPAGSKNLPKGPKYLTIGYFRFPVYCPLPSDWSIQTAWRAVAAVQRPHQQAPCFKDKDNAEQNRPEGPGIHHFFEEVSKSWIASSPWYLSLPRTLATASPAPPSSKT